MIYLMAVLFPLVAITCGIATIGALVKFVIRIQRDKRSDKT